MNNNIRLDFKKANEYLRNNQFRLAIQAYQELIKVDNKFNSYYENLCYTYKLAGSPILRYFTAAQNYIYGSDVNMPKFDFESGKVSDKLMNLSVSNKTTIVIVPVYNAEDTIVECIDSILSQTYQDVWVIAVDDCSKDNSYQKLLDLQNSRERICVLRSRINLGTYNCVNLGLYFASQFNFGYFLIHGADDVMHPDKINLQIKSILNKENSLASIAGYNRVDIKSKKILKTSNRGHSMAIYSKKVFDKLGYYDDTRFGGDSEYWQRFELCFGKDSQCSVTKPLTNAYYGDSNLTASNPDVSNHRQEYVETYKLRHQANLRSGNWFYDFDVDYMLGKYNSLRICGLATVPGREEALKDTIRSIVNQVDKIFVYQNGFKCAIDDPTGKVEIISSLDTKIDMGDAGKFFAVDRFPNCYYFSIDDDLIYPSDYVNQMIALLDEYKNRAIVSCHGRIMKSGARSFYKDIQENFRCLDKVDVEKFIHFGGTGVMAFHTRFVKFKFQDCKAPNMADIWMGLFARENQIPIVIKKHDSGWILHSDKFDENETIFRKYKSRHGIQDRLLAKFDTSYVYHPKKIKSKIKVAFISCAYKRPEVSLMFKKNLLKLQQSFCDDCDFINILIDSEDSNKEVFGYDKSFIYHNYANLPLSDKWLYTLDVLKENDFDYVFIIGSDNTIDDKIFERYISQMKKGVDIIGITDMHIYDLIGREMYYWGGYPKKHKRHGETIGLGRCFSKRVIEQMDFKLWDKGLNKGLDGNMRQKLEILDDTFTSYAFSSKGLGVACDIKGGFNVSELKDFLPICQKVDVATKADYEKRLI